MDMLLPCAEDAYIDDQKLIGYCLSETHITGKHKAIVFKSALGITAEHYLLLKDTILKEIRLKEADYKGVNQQGDLYSVDVVITFNEKQATIRTAWLARFGEPFPRLVSCYVKNK